MLANLREKLLNVNIFNVAEESPVPVQNTFNLNAGASILLHFQQQWEILHKLNEDNAKKAEIVTKRINEISAEINNNKENVKLLTHLVSSSNLTETISNCLHSMTILYETANKVEDELINFEKLIDEIEFQKLKTQHLYHLGQYKKRKEENFEKIKTTVELQHSTKMKEYETSKQKISEERQKVFQDAFKSDLETYKSSGTIPKNNEISKISGTILEEIELDYDENELDQFFNN